MRMIRFLYEEQVRMGAVTDEDKVYVLPQSDFMSVVKDAEQAGMTPAQYVSASCQPDNELSGTWESFKLLPPVEAPEVWAAGVTYQKSREARNYEATGGKQDAQTFYDKVYDAERPEIFFKSTAARIVGPNQHVRLRSDSQWQIPEPELGLVLSREGKILGYTAGNDMSCRDIEGENPLYLPQAKMWSKSCSIGPAIRLAETVENPYDFQITCRIYRDERLAVEGTASTGQLRRKLDELVSYLIKDNDTFDGNVLLTGTCIVPPNDFTLQAGDRIEITISGIGTLVNDVIAS